MDTTRKTITLTKQQNRWIKAQIARGDYTNDSEYIRDLVRRDQDQKAKSLVLRQTLQEGQESGISPNSLSDIWYQAEQQLASED